MGPIFILGFPRSGTTALASALRQLPMLQSAPLEGPAFYAQAGHSFPLFAGALRKIRGNALHENSILRDTERKRRFATEFARAMNAVFSINGDPGALNWIDKTLGIRQVEMTPELLWLYPSAKFIYIYRSPDEVVRSHLANWPSLTTGRELEIAQNWVACSAAWRNVKRDLPEGSYWEILQKEVLTDPAEVAEQLGDLLQLDAAARQILTAYLDANKRINRPRKKARAQVYDAVHLPAETRANILESCADELGFWPRLAKAT